MTSFDYFYSIFTVMHPDNNSNSIKLLLLKCFFFYSVFPNVGHERQNKIFRGRWKNSRPNRWWRYDIQSYRHIHSVHQMSYTSLSYRIIYRIYTGYMYQIYTGFIHSCHILYMICKIYTSCAPDLIYVKYMISLTVKYIWCTGCISYSTYGQLLSGP